MLLVGQAVWSEQTLWSVSKTTAAADKDLVVRVAGGLGECMVKQMCKNTTHQPEQLSRLGIEALKGQPFLNISPSSGNIEARLMSFLLHLMEARWWSYMSHEKAMPDRFAAILSPVDSCRKALEYLSALWEASIQVESARNMGDSAAAAWKLRQEFCWLSWPLSQFIMRLLAHHNWLPTSSVVNFLQVLFNRIGDTKCIEETHRIGRAIEKRHQQPDVLSMHTFYGALQNQQTPLAQRGIPHICTPPSGVYQPPQNSAPPHPWCKVFGKQALLKLPATCQVNMKDFKSYTPHSGKPSIAAAAALVHLNTTGQLDKAGEMWHAVTLMPHSLVRNLNQVFLVIAQGRFGAQAWPAEKVCPTSEGQGGQRRWGFKTSCNFVWIFTESLSNWFFIDFEWEINNCQVMDFGFLVAREKYADDMPMSISLTSGDENRSHVPVLAEALVTQGRYRLTKHDCNALCHDGTSKPKNLAAGKDEEVKMLENCCTIMPHFHNI